MCVQSRSGKSVGDVLSHQATKQPSQPAQQFLPNGTWRLALGPEAGWKMFTDVLCKQTKPFFLDHKFYSRFLDFLGSIAFKWKVSAVLWQEKQQRADFLANGTWDLRASVGLSPASWQPTCHTKADCVPHFRGDFKELLVTTHQIWTNLIKNLSRRR